MPKQAVAYDFRRPNKFNRDHVRALQIANETFARQFTTVLATTARAVCQVSLRGLAQRTYDEHVQEIPNPSYMAIVALKPLSGASLLHVPLQLVYAAIDRLLGGPGVGHPPKRPVTEIEAAVLRNLLARVLKELAYAYETLAELTPEFVYHESNPQFAQVAAPSDMCVVASFDIRIGSASGITTMCTPFSTLQPVLDELTNDALEVQQRVDPVLARASIVEQLAGAPLPVRVAFAPVQLASADIVTLQPGDLVPLHHGLDEPVAVRVGDVDCFTGRIGKRGSRLACVVLGPSTTGR